MGRQDIVNRLVYICKQEGIELSKKELTEFVEATNGDIRQVVLHPFNQ